MIMKFRQKSLNLSYLSSAVVFFLSIITPSLARELCGHGGNRANCVPINDYKTPDFINDLPSGGCFITDTNYTTGWKKCRFLKLYGNNVITFSSGGIHIYAPDVPYRSGGWGGDGYGRSQGAGAQDFFALRLSDSSESQDGDASENAFDWYELKDGIYKFGYYDCGKIFQGGAVDDFTNHYFCSEGTDLFAGCNDACDGQLQDFRAFNFTSHHFGNSNETTTSQLFY